MNPDNNLPPQDDGQAPTDIQPSFEPPVEENPSYSPEVINLDREPNSMTGNTPAESPEESSFNNPEPTQPAVSSDFRDPAVTPEDTTPVAPVTPKRKSKKMIVGGVLALGLAVLLGGGAAVYGLWYQNPQKVVTDAIVNMMHAESTVVDGTLNITNLGDASNSVDKLTLTLDGKSTRSSGEMNAKLSVDAEGQNYTLEGSALIDSDANLYFKVKDIDKLAEEYMGFGSDSSATLDPIIEKVNDKWIRVAAEDYEDVSKEASEAQKCFADTIKKHENNRDSQAQLSQAYRNNQFIVIKDELGVKAGNIGYQLDMDSDQMKSFVGDLQDTDIYKDMQKCDTGFELNPEDIGESRSDDKVKFEVWISQLGHELRQMKLSVADEEATGELIVNTQFNQNVNVEAPKDFIPLKELIDDIMGSFNQQMAESMEQQAEVQRPVELSPIET